MVRFGLGPFNLNPNPLNLVKPKPRPRLLWVGKNSPNPDPFGFGYPLYFYKHTKVKYIKKIHRFQKKINTVQFLFLNNKINIQEVKCNIMNNNYY